MTWRMAKVAGAIDITVRVLEAVIETAPSLKFQNSAGKKMTVRELAGLDGRSKLQVCEARLTY
jgi:hypothetical protein